MIWLLRTDQPKTTEFAPAMDGSTGILPGLPSVKGKPVHVAFDGGQMTSDAGILLLAAVEQRLGIAERLANCIEDPRAPERVRHGLAEMIRYRALLIAAGYPDGNDCDALKSDPAFKMAVVRLPESGADLCSQPTISRLENLPGRVALKRMMAAMVEVFCDSFEQVPRRIVLDIDDTEDRVHGGQQLALFNAYYDSRCFQPIHIYEATTGKPVAIILRPGKTPDGAEVTLVLLHRVGDLAEDAAMGRISGEADKVRRYGEFRYAATSWKVERRVIARVEAGPQGADSRFIVTNLAGLPKALYEKVYCARGQAENLIKAHKLHLASDRTSCTKDTANQFRLLIHTAAYWLMLGLRDLAPRTSFWRVAQFDTIRLCLIKVAGRVTEMVTRIKIALPTAYPYQIGFADLVDRVTKLLP